MKIGDTSESTAARETTGSIQKTEEAKSKVVNRIGKQNNKIKLDDTNC